MKFDLCPPRRVIEKGKVLFTNPTRDGKDSEERRERRGRGDGKERERRERGERGERRLVSSNGSAKSLQF